MIYFIQAECSRAIKIGKANDPKSRLATFRTSAPEPLVLLGAVEGDYAEEAEYHRRFERYRLHGEWFGGEDLEAEVLSAIASANDPHVLSPSQMIDDGDPDPDDGIRHEGHLKCPRCGFDCVHPAGIEIRGVDDEPAFDDAVIDIAFWAECGCSWRLVMEYHEGTTQARIVIIKPCPSRR